MSYQIVQADLEADKDRILAFWAANHPKPLEHKYAWMYQNNPFGRARVWLLLHSETQELVGMGAAFPRQLITDGHRHEAAVLGDFLVHQAHRSLGPALQLQKSILQVLHHDELALLYGLPNRSAEFVFQRVGYRRLGTMIRLVKVMQSASLLSRYRVPAFARRLMGPLLDLALRILAAETWRAPKRYLVHEDYSVFDERFDVLWRSREAIYRNVLKRSAAYMKWKFQDDPDDTNFVFALSTRDETALLGCIVYRYRSSSIEILECIATDEAADDLLALFLKQARRARPVSIVINVLDDSVLLPRLKRFNFWRGSAGRNAYYCAGPQLKDCAETISRKDHWLLMESDEDT